VAILLDLQHVTFEGVDRSVLKDASLTISDADRIGVVGINGTGKSTLLRLITGELMPDTGRILRSSTLRLGYLAQIPHVAEGLVRDVLAGGWEVDALLDQLGMSDAALANTRDLSSGQLKRVALAHLFSQPRDLLILDEPTNHLDLNAIAWLEARITDFRGAVVIVSHDRFLLDHVTTRMVEIDRGATYVHQGGYSRLLEAQAERAAQANSAEQVRRNLARTELAWLRRGVKARSTKPQARIDAAQRLLASRPDAAAHEGALDFNVETPRLGNSVITAHHCSFAHAGRTVTITGLDLELGAGDRVGIVGPNGSGKSTLIRLLARELIPSSGTVKHGPTVRAAHFTQGDGDLNLNLSVQELVAGPQGTPGSPADQTLMKRFWFVGAQQLSPARELSGGERRRLQLLLTLARRPNVLFLDEPTNDLDLETIRLLEDFLSEWPGTLVVVSHDRTFLSRTTDRLLAIDADGHVRDVPGGIDAWIARAASGVKNNPPVAEGAAIPRGRLLRDAEKDMTRLERRRVTLSSRIAASTDYVEQTRWGAELEEVLADLAVAEERWLDLLD
jgi:ABC transport system ATP-binding/permease protein